MALTFSKSAPRGFLIDSDTQRFVQVSDSEYEAAKTAATADTPAPAETTPTPTTPTPTSTATTPTQTPSTATTEKLPGAAAVWKELNGVYHVIVNGQVVGTFSDPNVANAEMGKYQVSVGTFPPSSSFGSVQEATFKANQNLEPPSSVPEAPGEDVEPPPNVGDLGDINAQRAKLEEMGIDTSALSTQQIGSLFALTLFTDLRAEQDKSLAPESLSAEDMAAFLNQAKSEFSPFFAEQIDLGRQDFLNSIQSLTSEAGALAAAQNLQFEGQQRATGEAAAERGTARSGIRKRAESELKQRQSGLIQSSRRKLEQQTRSTTTGFERRFGSEALGQAGVPQITFQGQEVDPGATGGLLGTFAKEREVLERGRQSELAQQEVTQRALLAGIQVI